MPQIGEVKGARELGNPYLTEKYMWWPCPICDEPRWILMRHGELAYPRCRRCANKELSKRPRRWKNKICGMKNPNWRGGLAACICLECGKFIFNKPSVLKKGSGKFCSCICRNKYNRRMGVYRATPTKPERAIMDICKKFELPYKYVGDGQVWLGNRNPDFINTNGRRQVIEMLGTYWHPLFDGAERLEHYKQFGFDCLVIWEDELKNSLSLERKLRRFNKKAELNA